MKRLIKIAALMAAPLAASLAVQAQAQRAPASVDWTKTVTVTPQGGFILGNPNARTKLVEYMSYSCPHCAAFANEAMAELKTGWIKRGALSIEYRNFVRDPFDLSASLIARCGGQARFLANHEGIFSTFEAWVAKAESYAPAKEADRTTQLSDIADKVGFIALATRNGLTADAARKCLADPKALDTIMALRAGALKDYPDFEGTPTFILDGKWLSGVHGWAQLKPLLPPLPAPGK